MRELAFFEVDQETTIAVEVDADERGFEHAGPREMGVRAAETFNAALAHGRKAAEAALRQFKEMASRPDEIELVLGLKLTAEAGAVLARTATEGHIQIKLSWHAAE